MSKLLSIGLIAGAIGVGSFQMANAGYRNRWHVCSGTPTETVRVEAAPAQTSPIPLTSGSLAAQAARTDGQSYRSFSAEPAPAATFQPGTVYYYRGVSSGVGSTQNDPGGTGLTVPITSFYGGGGGAFSTSRGGTARAPY
jgi:hypothetical protein